ncbi:hypothetical protein [Amycolatopsis jiangsuensis]|uniref:Uncharacterized protein n=1 Tax=Amycolatopsis jiangsuensis TaxID=1181879 RepID=A0A840J103_9PSEU|nr:hypothetical protein [Amycolatopsis jiangsuensis]MBB4687613.1 hypothetical protein [Amycolatopsis jiangsuensis]
MTEAVALGVPAKGLRSHALSMVSSTVIGMSSTVPAYSIAATLGFVVSVYRPVRADWLLITSSCATGDLLRRRAGPRRRFCSRFSFTGAGRVRFR